MEENWAPLVPPQSLSPGLAITYGIHPCDQSVLINNSNNSGNVCLSPSSPENGDEEKVYVLKYGGARSQDAEIRGSREGRKEGTTQCHPSWMQARLTSLLHLTGKPWRSCLNCCKRFWWWGEQGTSAGPPRWAAPWGAAPTE